MFDVHFHLQFPHLKKNNNLTYLSPTFPLLSYHLQHQEQ